MARLGATEKNHLRFWGAAVVWLSTCIGCEGPPPPTRPRPSATTNQATSKALEFVTAPSAPDVLEISKTAARAQAGLDAVLVQISEVADLAPPGRQAELVRQAVKRNPPAIIVEAPATPDPELAKAVAEARAKGVLVIVLGSPLGESTGDGPGREVLIVSESFEPPAARIVATAQRNAATGKIDPKSGALILFQPRADALVSNRIDALKKALSDAGVAEVFVEPTGPDLKLTEYLAAHPKVTLVLSADATGFAVAEAAVKDDHPYVMAGFTALESSAKSYVQTGEYAAIGVYIPDRLIRKGISTATHVLRGRPVGDRVEIEIPVVNSGVHAGLPRGPVAPPPAQPD